jgi:hypothetical protein
MIEAIFRVESSRFKNFPDYVKKYGLTDITQIAVLFEGVGVLLQQKQSASTPSATPSGHPWRAARANE